MRAFYEAFSIGIAIFACILFLITMGKAVAGDLALWQWIALVTLVKSRVFALCVQMYEDTL